MFSRQEIKETISFIEFKMKLRTERTQLYKFRTGSNSLVKEELLRDLCMAYATARGLMGINREQFLVLVKDVVDQLEDLVNSTIKVTCKVIDNGEH